VKRRGSCFAGRPGWKLLLTGGLAPFQHRRQAARVLSQRWLQGHGWPMRCFCPGPSAATRWEDASLARADRGRRRHNASGGGDVRLSSRPCALCVRAGVCQHHVELEFSSTQTDDAFAGWISSRCGSMRQRRWPRWAQNIRSSVPSRGIRGWIELPGLGHLLTGFPDSTFHLAPFNFHSLASRLRIGWERWLRALASDFTFPAGAC